MLKYMGKINYVIAVIVIALGIIAVSMAMGTNNNVNISLTEKRERFEDWSVLCLQNDSNRNGSDICFGEYSQTEGSTAILTAQLKMIDRAGELIPRLKVIAPLGIFLPAGVSLTLPDQDPFIVPVQFCDVEGCFVNLDLASDVVQALSNSDELGVSYLSSNHEPLNLAIKLNGFIDALAYLKQ